MSWLEKFASEKKTNIYKDHLLEADRRIHRMSVMYEVLEEAPSDDAVNIVDFLKNKLTEVK
jgi:hypothetical protein